jgi:hypothetical protein
MKHTTIDDLHKKWMRNPKYRREYEALAEEFSLAGALIEARARAGLTQEQVAQRMKTTQAVVARLEGGGSMPSTRTLKNTPGQRGRGSESVLSRKGRGHKPSAPAWAILSDGRCEFAPHARRRFKAPEK